MDLEKVKIKRIIGPTPSGAAVLLGNDVKTFVVFVGLYEAAALIREINQEVPARPLTHELIQNIFLGFDVGVKHVVISSILENTFCATLILEQNVSNDGEEWRDRRNEVRIDARPSDCFVLALKNKVDVFVTKEVFDQVQDVTKMTDEVEGSLAAGVQLEGQSLGNIEFDLSLSEGDSDPSDSFLDMEESCDEEGLGNDDDDDDDEKEDR